MSEIFSNLQQWQQKREQLKGRIGFVPTMGALHAGHASLIRQAKAENDFTVVSIFVNPTQFNNPDDLANYPNRQSEDLAMLKAEGVDFALYPNGRELYADNYNFRVSEHEFSSRLEGQHRPGHFDGVLTVVLKLFNLVRPSRAYFGEKDYQQLHLIQAMKEAFFLNLEVIACPTVREPTGLAMSSRNMRLSVEEREKLAPRFYSHLTRAASADEARARLEAEGFRVDYVVDENNRRLGAVFLGDIRLIDNVSLGASR